MIFSLFAKKPTVDSLKHAIKTSDLKWFRHHKKWLTPNTGQTTFSLNLMHEIIQSENIKLIDFFINKLGYASELPVNDKNMNGLHLAALRGNIDLLDYFYPRINSVQARDGDGFLPIHYAVCQGNQKILAWFKEKQSSLLDQDNHDRDSLLHLAVKKNQKSNIEWLILNDFPLDLQNHEGTAFYWAACFGDQDLAIYLIEKGADPHIPGKGGSAFYLTSCFGRERIFKHLLTLMPDLNILDQVTGESALHGAAKNGNIGIVRLLLEHKADSNVKTSDQNTPLHSVALSGHLQIAETLYNHGAEINAVNHDGKTPLYLASEKNYIVLCEWFMANGATLSTPTGESLSLMAKKRGFDVLSQKLKSRESN